MFSRLFSLFSTPAPTPPPADVHIVPCTGMDLSSRRFVVTTGFIIDARLDPKKLEASLLMLVERKFPRAGARLAHRNGVYEFHIPHTFDARTPAVAFTAEDHPEPYASPARPSIEHLCDSSAREPWICDLVALDPYLRSDSCPKTLETFLVPNTPLVHVHVAVFDDLTFIGVTSSHIVLDAVGTGTLLHAWTRLLGGDALDDIPGMAWDIAPFATFTAPTKVHWRGWFKLGVFSTFSFIVRFMLRIWRDPEEVGKFVRMPKVFLEDRKRVITEELQAEGSSEWVSSSDVLLAWWFKTSYSHRTDSAPLHIHLPIDLRDKRIFPGPSGTGAIATPYINNAVSGIPIPPIPVNAFKTASLRDLALRFRRSINAYNADLPGIAADVHWRCANPLAALFPCPPGAEYLVATNWRAARFGALDFSGAIATAEGEGEKQERKARVLFLVPMATSGKKRPMRGSGAVLMEDENTIWMSQIRGAKDWEVVRKAGGVEFL